MRLYTPSHELDFYVYAGPQPGFIKPEEIRKQHVILGVETGSFEYSVGKHTGKASFGDLVFVPSGVLFKRRSFGYKLISNVFFSSSPK